MKKFLSRLIGRNHDGPRYCSRCGYGNPPGSTYCGSCGAYPNA